MQHKRGSNNPAARLERQLHRIAVHKAFKGRAPLLAKRLYDLCQARVNAEFGGTVRLPGGVTRSITDEEDVSR